MVSFDERFFAWQEKRKSAKEKPQILDVNKFKAYSGQYTSAGFENTIYDGEKFPGGFGATELFETDYWTLRKRSAQLFNNNLYARGIVRRLVTNEINVGLNPESTPDEQILGLKEDSLNDWTEDVENRYNIWHKNPELCDWKQVDTFGALQRVVRMESLIEGDILVVIKQSKRTKLPTVQLISGGKVKTPLDIKKIRKGHKIKHGVEIDQKGLVVAHWIQQDDLSSKRIPVKGEKSGRKISWLIYGTDKRLDDLRGQPLLSIVLQSLKEIDRYRDSTQRKATINSILAMFIKKTEDKMGTNPMQGGAVKRDTATITDPDGETRKFNVATQIPGLVLEELQTGEEPVFKGGDGTDINFGLFEETIIQAVAWSLGIPPEILRLTFSNNYSASQAAINEFKIAINQVWGDFGETFCTPIFIDWLLSEVLMGKIKAPGLLESWRNPMQYDKFGAWVSVEWYGSVKPSTDMLKQAKGSQLLIKDGWSTNAREARVTTGTKFSKNIKRLKKENEQKIEAMRPLYEFKKEFGNDEFENTTEAIAKNKLELIDLKRGQIV
jgi:lambda family phage portal protein